MDSRVQTFTGRSFDIRVPMTRDIDIRDIAHQLAMTCRFRGATRVFYSVAEHSVRVALLLSCTGARELAPAGLLHDASEAYLGDVPTPQKHTWAFAAFPTAEDRVQRVICAHFGVPREEPQLVRQADLRLLATERAALLAPALQPEIWGDLPEPLPGPYDDFGWAPAEAESMFLSLFRSLFFDSFLEVP